MIYPLSSSNSPHRSVHVLCRHPKHNRSERIYSLSLKLGRAGAGAGASAKADFFFRASRAQKFKKTKNQVPSLFRVFAYLHQQKVNQPFTALPNFWQTFHIFFDSGSWLTRESGQKPEKARKCWNLTFCALLNFTLFVPFKWI